MELISRSRTRLARLVRSLALLGATGFVVLPPPPAQAQVNVGLQRAADGTVYEIVSVAVGDLTAQADEFRVTTVAGGIPGVGGAPATNVNDGGVLKNSAIVGADTAIPQTLRPFGDVQRTAILAPSSLTEMFDPTNGGKLTLGSGGGAKLICKNSADCGGLGEPVVALSNNADGVAAACVAAGVMALATSTQMRNTFAFGITADASHNCTGGSPTTDAVICGGRPADGFTLQKGKAIVFIYDSGLANQGFGAGAAGFGIDTDGTNTAGCPSTSQGEPSAPFVVSADQAAPAVPPKPPTTLSTPTPAQAPALGPPTSPAFVLTTLGLLIAGAGLLARRARRGGSQ